MVFFATSISLKFLVGLTKSAFSLSETLRDILKPNSGCTLEENVLLNLQEQSANSRDKIDQDEQTNKSEGKILIDDETMKKAHLGYMKGIPLQALYYCIAAPITKAVLPNEFGSLQLIDIIFCSLCLAALAALYNIASDIVLVFIADLRQKIDATP